jgi:hypothetical protein
MKTWTAVGAVALGGVAVVTLFALLFGEPGDKRSEPAPDPHHLNAVVLTAPGGITVKSHDANALTDCDVTVNEGDSTSIKVRVDLPPEQEVYVRNTTGQPVKRIAIWCRDPVRSASYRLVAQ